MRRIGWIGALALGLLGACSSKNGSDTRILVAVWTDFAIPAQMNSVRIDVKGPTTTPSTTFPLAADTKFPLVFELVSPDNKGSAFSVTATGYLGATRLVSQQAHVSFIPKESLVLSLFLGRTCRNIDCPADWTCSDGQCDRPIEVNPSTLPTYDPKVPFTAPDASAGIDASVDGGAGTRIDGSRMDVQIDTLIDATIDAMVDATVDVRPAADGGGDLAMALPDSARDAPADVATFADISQDLPRDRLVAEDLVRDLVTSDAAPDAPAPDLPGRDAPEPDVDAPPDSPACPYACCAASDCPGTCQMCDVSHTCVSVVSQEDPSGHCAGTCDATGACKAKPGQSCAAVPGGCIAGTSCADGYCCDRACTDACEACDVPQRLGTCTTLGAGTPPRHTGCVSTVPTCAGTCNGTSASCFYTTGPCGTASCTGSTFQPIGACRDGACNYPSPLACPNGEVCAGDVCACNPPMTTCPGGACVNPQTDAANCGACGESCSSNHGTGSCTDGICHMACAGDYRDCSTNENAVRDGCETYVADNPNNCGQCGRICPNDWAHATPSCAASDCGHLCTAPWENCDGLPGNGCEANLDTDAINCGRCTNPCASTVCRARTCLTTTRYGNTGPGSTTTGFSGGNLAGIQVYIAQPSVITGFGVVIHSSGTARNMYIGLYKDVLGNPTDLVATAGPFQAMPAGTEIPAAAQVDIPNGNYWLLGIWDGPATFASNSTTPVAWRYASQPFGPLPTPAPVAMSPGSYPPPNLYAIVAQ